MFYDLAYSKSWRTLYVHLRIMCILLLLGGVFCSFCLVSLVCSAIQVFYFPVYLLSSYSIHYRKWDIEVSIIVDFLPLILHFVALLLTTYMFVCVKSSKGIEPFIIVKCPSFALVTTLGLKICFCLILVQLFQLSFWSC